jgi:hypothetical protein
VEFAFIQGGESGLPLQAWLEEACSHMRLLWFLSGSFSGSALLGWGTSLGSWELRQASDMYF